MSDKPDPLSVEAFEALKAEHPSSGYASPYRRAEWTCEVAAHAIQHCKWATDEALWDARREYMPRFMQPHDLPDIGSTHRTVTITESEHKRLQVFERAYKLMERTASFTESALSSMMIDYVRTLEVFGDAKLAGQLDRERDAAAARANKVVPPQAKGDGGR